tara:strand:- start:353 stop:586 length:234 start_codon:yes stop_codon:yes gene_type:complete
MVPLRLFIWALDTKKTRINRYRSYVMGGAGERLLEFMEFPKQLSGVGVMMAYEVLIATPLVYSLLFARRKQEITTRM